MTAPRLDLCFARLATAVVLPLVVACSGSSSPGPNEPHDVPGGGGGISVTGTITGLGGVPAEVSLDDGGAGFAVTTTNASGQFAFDAVASASYTVTATASGWTFAPASRSVLVSGASVSGVNFTAGQTGTGSWRISGTVTGPLVEGLTLTLDGDASATTATASDGTYHFDVPSGLYLVSAAGPYGTLVTPGSRELSVGGAAVPGQNFTSYPDPYVEGCSIAYGAPVSRTVLCRVTTVDYSAGWLGARWGFGITTEAVADVGLSSTFDLEVTAVPSFPVTLGLGDSNVLSSNNLVQAAGGMWLGGKGQNIIGALSATVTSETSPSAIGLGLQHRPHGSMTATLEPTTVGSATLTVTATF